MGALVASLRARGVLDRTVILYASDNGFLRGEHRLGGKIRPYEESIRVPLVVRVPWRNAWGTTNNQLVLNIDYASTLAQWRRLYPGRSARATLA
jgi:N-acetylglucosamine-6-sulfatase